MDRPVTLRHSRHRRRLSSDIALSQMAQNLLAFTTDFPEQHLKKASNLVLTP